MTPKHESKLLGGAPLTPDVATRLALVTDIAARIWLNQEAVVQRPLLTLVGAREVAGPLLSRADVWTSRAG